MANTDVKPKAVNIYIDDAPLIDAYNRLVKKQDEYNKKIDESRKKQNQLTADIQKTKDAGKNYEGLSKQLTKVNTDIGKNEKALKGVVDQQKNLEQQINSKTGPSLRQMQTFVQRLENEYKNLGQNTDEAKNKLVELGAANKVLDQMKNKLNEVKNAQKATNEQAGLFGKIFSGALAANLVASAIGKVKSLFSDVIEEAIDADKKITQFRNTLDTVGRSDAFERLTNAADDMQKKFSFLDNDDIIQVFRKLIDYGKLTEGQIRSLTPVIIDFATKTGLSLEEASNQIIQAIGGGKVGGELRRFGTNLKDAKDEGERLNIVMTDLKSKVDGAGDAFAKSASGGIASAKQQFKDLKEEIGTGLLPVLNALLTFLVRSAQGAKKLGEDLLQGFVDPILDKFAAGREAIYAREAKKLQKINEQIGRDMAKEFIGATDEAINDEISKIADEIPTLEKVIIAKKRAIDGGYENENDRKELRQRTDRQQALQAELKELQSLISKNPLGIDVGGSGNYDDLLSKAEAFNKKLRDLVQQSEDANLTANQKEIADARHKYEEILIEYHKVVKELGKSGIPIFLEINGIKKKLTEADITKLEEKELQGILLKQQRETNDKLARQGIEDGEKRYKEALQVSDAIFEQEKQERSKQLIAGEINETQYQADIAAIDVLSQQNRLAIAKVYSGYKVTILENGVEKEVALVKTADEDLTKFKKEILDKQTADQLAAFKKREENIKLFDALEKQTALSHAQAKVTTAENPAALLKAQQELLKVQHEQQTKDLEKRREELLKAAGEDGELQKKANDDINQQIADADAIFQQQQDELKRNHLIKEIQQELDFAKQALSIIETFFQSRNNKEQAAFNKEISQNNQRKAAYQRLLNQKLISQQEFNRRIHELDADLDKKKSVLAKKEFERNKKLQIAQALINGALAVTNIWATTPKADFGVSTYIMLALSGIATLAAVSKIAKTEYDDSSGSKFEKGGIAKGSKHAEGGINLVDSRSGKKVGEMEDQEPYMILSGKTYKNNKRVVDQLLYNSMYKDGARIQPVFLTRTYKSFDYEGINKTITKVRYFESGGIIQTNASASTASTEAPPAQPTVISALTPDQELLLRTLYARLNEPIEAVVVYSKLQTAGDRLNQIKADSTFKNN